MGGIQKMTRRIGAIIVLGILVVMAVSFLLASWLFAPVVVQDPIEAMRNEVTACRTRLRELQINLVERTKWRALEPSPAVAAPMWITAPLNQLDYDLSLCKHEVRIFEELVTRASEVPTVTTATAASPAASTADRVSVVQRQSTTTARSTGQSTHRTVTGRGDIVINNNIYLAATPAPAPRTATQVITLGRIYVQPSPPACVCPRR